MRKLRLRRALGTQLGGLAVLFLLGGCATRSSSFTPLPVVMEENVPMHTEGLPPSHTGCGWVAVQEQAKVTFLGIPLKTDVRQFERALFYCCPGDEGPDPKCYQTDWFFRSKK